MFYVQGLPHLLANISISSHFWLLCVEYIQISAPSFLGSSLKTRFTLLINRLSFSLQVYARNLSEKARELEYEKELSDSLLYQMLPATVAKQLKQTQQVSRSLFYLTADYGKARIIFLVCQLDASTSSPYILVIL